MSKESCPICQKETVFKFRPFCSSRCKLIDLQKWMSGAYAIPAEDANEQDNFKKDEETL